MLTLISVALLAQSSVRAQCTGVPEWENADASLMRCGRPGYVNTNTYFFFEQLLITDSRTTGAGAGTQFEETDTTYTGPHTASIWSDACRSESHTYTSVGAPAGAYYHVNTPCSADLNGPSSCDSEGGCQPYCPGLDDTLNSSLALTLYSHMLDNYWGCSLRTDIVLSNDLKTVETYTPGCASYDKDRLEVYRLSVPYTLPEFIQDTMAAARQAPWMFAGPNAPFYYLNWDTVGGATMDARVLRYRIKFKTKLGAKYNVKWKLRIDELDNNPTPNVTNSYVLGPLSQTGIIGDGKEMSTRWFHPPDPSLTQWYAAKVICVEVSSTEGSCGASCGSEAKDSPGDGADSLNSASFFISLGAGTVDESAGVLSLDEAVPSTATATIAALHWDVNASVVTVVTNADGTIDLAAPTLLARIVTNSQSYWIHCSAKAGDGYLTNAPFISHLISNPNGSTNPDTLRHVRFRGGSAVTNEFTCEVSNATNQTWTLVSGNCLKGERLAKMTDTNALTRLESYSVFNPATHQQLYRRDRLYWTPPDKDLLLSEIVDPEALALTTTNSYDSLGRLQLSLQPDGSWERYEYDANGWLMRTARPFRNQPPTVAASDCRVTEYSYGTVPDSPDSPGAQPGKPRTVLELLRGVVVSKTMLAYAGDDDTYTQVAAQPNAGWNNPSNETSRVVVDAQFRTTRVENPDLTSTSITYDDVSGPGRLTTTISSDSSGTEFERSYEQVDALGRRVGRTTIDRASGISTSAEWSSDPDAFGRPTTIRYLDGTAAVNVRQDCCHSAYTVDRDGIATTNFYDALNRLVATKRLGITTSNLLDAADRLLAHTRKGTDGSLIRLTGMAYDPAGRLIRQTNALNGVTSYSDTVDAAGQRVLTITNANGATRTEIYFRDGQLAKVTGTAAFPVRYEYGRQADGADYRAYTKEIKLDGNGQDTPEWTKTLTDGIGHSYKTILGGTGTNQTLYNSKGQLWKQVDADGVSTCYTNNARGELEYTCIDSDRNDVMDLGGQDRILQTVNDVLSDHGVAVLRTRTYVWETHGSSTSTLLSTVETSVDGLTTWRDTAGAMTTTVKSVPSGGAYTITETAPDGSYSVSSYQNGRLASVARYAPGGAAPLGLTSYGYDAHGRRNKATDARNGTTTFTFNLADQVVSVTTPPPGNGGSPQTTTTYYDAMLRVTNVVQPDGATVATIMSPRGELLLTAGSRAYPVGYAYDAQGRLRHMTNWTSFSTGSTGAGARVTTWHYDASRGWMTNKVYDDGRGTKYGYTAAGRLSSRLWARGINTTYSYNKFGEVSGVAYNDGATPAVTYGYDRRGRQETSTQSGNSWKRFYGADGQLRSEAGTAGVLRGLAATNTFDAYLRRTNVAMFNGGVQLAANGYGYDSAGRLGFANEGIFSATYGYLANSPFIGQIVFRSNGAVRLTANKSYDLLNRLTTVSSAGSGSSPSQLSFAYSYNDANQRTRVDLVDGSFWAYEYDILGQVKGGKRYWSDGTPVAGQQFGYGFDDIGNRTSSKAGGDANGTGLRAANYTVNSLNQITQRDVPGTVDILGAASATATNVNVNNQLAYRRGEYYQVALPVNNASSARWQSVTSRAVQNGTTNSVTGNTFLPKTPEQFRHDADGNLTSDGRWAYTWDGENRLVRMVEPTSLPSGSSKTLVFVYDPEGRRISKTVSNWTGSAWSKVLDEKYLYDGWNLLAVLNGTNNALLQSFLWGLDLSGSPQGAGGVGGLLEAKVPGQSVAFAVYDGNGNVGGLVDAANGTLTAQYEYGPFGEVLRCSGSAAKSNPFRFSTKYQDDESEFLYYGYRYYNPSAGRWLSRDPSEESGGLNLHGAAHNDLVNLVDILGLGPDDGNNQEVILKQLQSLVDEANKWEVMKLGGWMAALEKLKGYARQIRTVTVNPSLVDGDSVAQYVTGESRMNLRGKTPEPITVAHEMVHAYNDIAKTGLTGQRDDEGMAYAFEAIHQVLSAMTAVEGTLRRNIPCSRLKQISELNWRAVWKTRNRPSSFSVTWKAAGIYRKTAALENLDFQRVKTHLGAYISCQEMADLFSALASRKGCCFVFTCKAGHDSAVVNDVPAGVEVAPSFK